MKEFIMENLVRLRKSKKLKQSDVAKNIEVPVSTYGCWENNVSQPNIKNIKKLVDYFDVSTDIILDRRDYSLQDIKNDLERAKEKFMASLPTSQQTLIETMLRLNELQQIQVQSYMQGMLSK